ncbi:MAG: hypothetical protein PHE48_01925 [Candidatus Daviesbacteria bacterium]|nr:hypothetical protein [Candidatus Daviesbacteria bacterium]
MLQNGKLEKDCTATFYQGIDKLSKITVHDNRIKGFVYSGQCSQGVKGGERVFYPIDNFYPFRIKNGEIINIKQEILSELTFLLRLNK